MSCTFCCPPPEGLGRVPYMESSYFDLYISREFLDAGLLVRWHGCPPFARCSANGLNTEVFFPIKYCPECGAPIEIEKIKEPGE